MKTTNKTLTLLTCTLLAIAPAVAIADGNEVLGAPSIDIEQGSGLVTAGTGLFTQPGTIDIDVPASATVQQVLLYWYGRGSEDGINGDNTIMVDGTEVTGTAIGKTNAVAGPPSQAFRADITSLGLISPGSNSIELSGLEFTFRNDGAGLLVIFDDGSGASDIQIRDGHDFAQEGFPGQIGVTIPVIFIFDSTDFARTATVDLFIGDAEESRPDAVEITVGGITSRWDNVAVAGDGDEWDTLHFLVDIPAGETMVTVQALSVDDETEAVPDSIAWLTAGISVPKAFEVLACRVTGGGVDKFGQWNGRWAKAECENADGLNCYTFGGQAGAPTASQPQPYGEWTHHQSKGPAGSFIFHAGTASAPPGTEIDLITCSDPGWCVQARPAPAKQIDFEGIGTFKNIKKPPLIMSNCVDDVSYHWFTVHIEDLGEPGKGRKQDPPDETCPPEGSAGEIADCNCPDFYRITIYDAFAPDMELANKIDVIYEVYGYINGGNLQIHPPIEKL